MHKASILANKIIFSVADSLVAENYIPLHYL